jgi:hypothetical protein
MKNPLKGKEVVAAVKNFRNCNDRYRNNDSINATVKVAIPSSNGNVIASFPYRDTVVAAFDFHIAADRIRKTKKLTYYVWPGTAQP